MMEFKTSLLLVLLTGFTLVSCQKGDYGSYLETAMNMIEKVKDNIPPCVEGVPFMSCEKGDYRSYLETARNMIAKAKVNIPPCVEDHDLQASEMQKPVDCADILKMGFNTSGVYEIWPIKTVTEGRALQVYCDMDTDRGGWTVIQRRGNFGKANDYFDKDWKDYKKGFKTRLEKDFWLGNDNLFALTNQKLYSVRFDMKDFNHEETYALYDAFWIDDENHKYSLHISNYSGNAGDAMDGANNKMFSTKDQDNSSTYYCAKRHKGGWWFYDCKFTNLNGIYYRRNRKWEYEMHEVHGVFWQNRPLDWTEIKIRPKNFL